MKKQLFKIGIIGAVFCMLLSGCKNVEKGLDNPSAEYVIECLRRVEGIDEAEAVTEDNDPNGQLNKKGGYTAMIYFSYDKLKENEDEEYEEDEDTDEEESVIERGTDAGGSIEVYASVKDAKDRDEYLSGFDGGPLSSGGHTVAGTIVVRTSGKLTASQQNELGNNIIDRLKNGK